ncbi:unnamed protein product [Rhizophagus irregularis]|nr:unnamed protein product [Rhizophagus irregularis]
MVRKTRSDKKNTTCDHCGRTLANPNKLREHLKRKNLCKLRTDNQEAIQDSNQTTIIQSTRPASEVIPIPSVLPKNEENRRNQREKQAPIPILGRDYITNEEAEKWVNPNARKPREHLRTWGKRLVKRWEELGLGECNKVENLDDCLTLCHDLEQYDEDAVRPLTKEELEKYEKMSEPKAGSGPRTQVHRNDNKSMNLINKEFERLGEITDEQERDLEFREQKELGTPLKRRAIAVHRAKVPRSHPDNRSDIRKMLESRRKQFKEILEKEFDKRRQFKFALCSLTKFLIDNKPGNDKAGKKNSRTDWLRNKQIIVYNRAEIDDYISDAFEQILYQVEERGGRSNA